MSEQGEHESAAAAAMGMAKQMAELRMELTLDDHPNDWSSMFARQSERDQ